MQSSEPAEPAKEEVDEKAALAKFRTQLALERTMLAWVRTTLSMVGFGFGMVAFFRTLYQSHPGAETQHLRIAAIAFGLTLLAVGLIAMFLAGLSQWADLRSLKQGQVPGWRQWPLSLTFSLVLLILGIIAFIALLVL